MDLKQATLDSWDRNCRIVQAVAQRIDESNKHLKPSPDGWPLSHQLAHIHLVRKFHLAQLDPAGAAALESSHLKDWEDPIDDLPGLRQMLDASGTAVRHAMQNALDTDQQTAGGYDHPLLFLQHLLFHEGWHVGLISLALRLAGQEIPEEWEEQYVWSEWRTE